MDIDQPDPINSADLTAHEPWPWLPVCSLISDRLALHNNFLKPYDAEIIDSFAAPSQSSDDNAAAPVWIIWIVPHTRPNHPN